MRAVSTSRISPTRMTSGSWRRIDFSPVAKVSPACSLVWIWLMEGKDVLDRVLDRHDVAGRVAHLGQGGIERGGLSAAGRAGAQHHAEGGPDDLGVTWRGCRSGMPRSSSRKTDRVLSRIRMTHFSPQMVAAVAHPDVDALCRRSSVVSWPSWGRRRSTMFMPAMILIRLTRPRPMAAGQHQDLLQGAVDAETDPHDVLRGSMWTSEARSRLAWVRMRSTTWTTGASSSTTSAAAASTSRRAGAFDRLECLNQLVHAADGPVAAVDGPPDVRARGEHEVDWSLARLLQQRASPVRGIVRSSDPENGPSRPQWHARCGAASVPQAPARRRRGQGSRGEGRRQVVHRRRRGRWRILSPTTPISTRMSPSRCPDCAWWTRAWFSSDS